jgi:hypothetical protein
MVNNKNKASLFSNLVLGSAAAGFILISVYTWHTSNIQQAPFNIKLVGLLIGCALFCIVALFMREAWKINLTVAVFSTIVTIYLVEIALFVYQDFRFMSVNIDTRSKLEVLEDMRSEGVDAWPQVLSWLFIESNGLQSDDRRIFPLGSISQKTIVYCNETGQYKIFKSDEHGFNNPEGLYSKGTIEAALVGDSFTIGSCVMSEEDIASQLRKKEIPSLNLGNGGNGPLIELALLKEYVEPIKPAIVLWIYYEGNDLLDLERERKSSILIRYLEDNFSQNLLGRQPEIDASLIKYVNSKWSKMRRLHLTIRQKDHEQSARENTNILNIIKLQHLRGRIGLLKISDQPRNPERITNFKTQIPLFSEILLAAYQRTSGWGGHLYFVYLPSMERYLHKTYDGNFYDRDDVLGVVKKLGIPLIDFHEVLNNHPDPFSLTPFIGAHYNAEGYRLLADLIASKLRKDGLIAKK